MIRVGLLLALLLVVSASPLPSHLLGVAKPVVARVDQALSRRFPALAVIETLWRVRAVEPPAQRGRLDPASKPCTRDDASASC